MIEIENIVKSYGKLVAVNGLSLSIGKGEIFGFIGPNGAGKSTTMKILACLLKPDSGRAAVGGRDVTKEGDEIRAMLGYMPDFLGVYEDLTVDEYLHFFASAFRIARPKRRKVIDGVLELTDLTHKRTSMVSGLSRGMQQRLGVARVLIHDPDVLLLDEPASGLDPRARIEIRSLLTELGRMGKTLMVSSHILSELAEMCDTIGIIEKGELLFSGTIDEAYERTDEGERIAIRLENTDAAGEAVCARLRSHAHVSAARPDDGVIRVELVPGKHGHHFLIEQVIAAGGRIAAFEPRGVNLEQAFMRLTRGKVQ
jgi:ABC-2 type transport system ATP-binding protein